MKAAIVHRYRYPRGPASPRYNAPRMPEDASQSSPPSPRAYVAQLYERYSEGLVNFFRASLPLSKQDATDLMQQTFEELLKWQSGDPSRTIAHPRAFLYQIANRRLIAYRDKLRRIPDLPQGPEPAMDDRSHRDDLEFMASQHESQRQALRAMRRMDNLDAQVILYLRYWEGLTEEGVAEALERGRATVAGQLRRAKKALLAKLAELEQAEPGTTRTSTTLLEQWWRRVEAQAKGVEPEEASSGDQFQGDGAPRRLKPR